MPGWLSLVFILFLDIIKTVFLDIIVTSDV